MKRGDYFEMHDGHWGWVIARINQVKEYNARSAICDLTIRHIDGSLHRFESCTMYMWFPVGEPLKEIPLDWVHPNVGILVEGTYVFHASYGHCIVVTQPTTDSMLVRYEATQQGKTIWVLYGTSASDVLYIQPPDTWSRFLAQDKNTPYLQVET